MAHIRENASALPFSIPLGSSPHKNQVIRAEKLVIPIIVSFPTECKNSVDIVEPDCRLVRFSRR